MDLPESFPGVEGPVRAAGRPRSSPRPRGWPRAACVSAAALALAAGSLPALRAEAPRRFAIRDARIVPVSGPVLEQGTVLVADGLITAVGAGVAVPPDAWVIDGKGLSVYPGLIDASTDLGLTSSAPAAGATGGGAGAPGTPRPVSRGPEDRPSSTPWVQAADEIRTDDRRLESWRSSGFTTALTAPRTGILPGQSAVINLAGERPGDLVLRAPASLQLNLQTQGGFGSFPGSLMGVVAYVRQVFVDTDHAALAARAWESDARSVERPDYDRTVRALQQARAAGLPVMITAQTPVQIARVLDLAAELKLQPVIVGAHQAYRAVDRLAAAKAPVVVSLKWPERDANADPEAPEMLRSLQVRASAPSTPAALERGGVLFAFASDGVQPRDLLKHVRKAIDAGLPADAALKALTINAARILGVDRRVGTIEPGKIANLVVADGDLFAEKTRVKLTFVDGLKYEPVEPPRPPASGDRQTQTTAGSLSGRWSLSVTTPDGVQTSTAELVQAADGSLSGTLTSPMGSVPISQGSVTGSQFTFGATMPRGPNTVALSFSGTVDGNTIKGTMTAAGFSGEFTGTRSGPSGSEAESDQEAR
jgi:imidazolonepropionase-like amidohydrolase